MTNLSTIMPTLSMYEKTPKQQTLTTLPNSCSPTNASTFQLGFSQAQAFNQATLSQSRAFYKDSDAMDFAFPNQAGVSKTQPQSQMNSYNMFCNYEPTEHFNLWKDNRSSQPSTPWWSSAGNAAGQIHASNSTVNDGAFSNWCDSINIGNMAGNRMMLTPGKSYQQQQHNEQHGRPGLGNAFENSRLFEVSISILSENVIYRLCRSMCNYSINQLTILVCCLRVMSHSNLNCIYLHMQLILRTTINTESS